MTDTERLIIINQIEIMNALRQTNNTVGLRCALMYSQRALEDDERKLSRFGNIRPSKQQ
jgi:hypothetical protein